MDSPMSHYDPTSVRQMEVVKGPYALTWGAGNLSAIRVTTQDVFAAADRRVHGSVQSGYDGNLGAEEAAAELRARLSDHVYFAGHGAWRQGDDYTAGDGSIVPADYSSAEGRGKLGFELARGSRLTLSGGYQGQGALDNPGNLLDATYFHTLNLSSRWQLDRNAGTLRHFDVLGYVNNVRHAMNNDNKPTAQANANRIPPFPLDVRVTSQVDVAGGRVAAELAPERLGWRVELGGDGYRAYRNAVRTLGRRDNGTTIFEDLMWPQATIVDGGLFARGSKQLGQVSFSATVRADAVHANADTASQFFRDSVSTDLSQSELNLSGAATLSFTLSRWWSLSFGLGSVVRTADASERYSDRVPASKAQTSAEFVGTPDLKPERSNQADVWLEGSYQRVSIHLNAFARRIDDYITLTPTTLPKRLPLSPNTVYRYVNGSADFYGFEVSPSVALTPDLTVGVGASYLYGQDRTVDEPALGVTPFTFRSQLRLEPVGGRYYVEGSSHTAAKQDRVATSRGEVATPGYTTFDVRAGVRPWRALELRGGVLNVTDKFYVNHLNAKNPFTGMQLPEPGRVVFLEASVTY